MEDQICLFRLPPHTSHALQPTDRGYFGAFKHNFSKEVAKFTVEYPGVSITKRQFPVIFTKAYELSCKMDTVMSSFRTTGIWPTNRLSVDHNLFNPAQAYHEPSSRNENISFHLEPAETSVGKLIRNIY